MHTRERAAFDTYKTLQVRKLLLATKPKIRALKRFLIKHDAEKRTTGQLIPAELC